jgi:translation initiation factor 3 subunit I
MIKFVYDGDLFFSSGKDGMINLIRTDTGERIGTYDGHQGAVYAIDVTFDMQTLVSCGADSKIMLFDVQTGDIKEELDHGGIIKFVEWNQQPMSQDRIVTCNDKFSSGGIKTPNRIMIWKIYPDIEKMLVIDDDLPMKATKVKWGAFDETLVSIHEEGTIVIWDAEDGSKIKEIDAHQGPVTGLNFTADRMLMVSTSRDMVCKLWAMDDVECIKVYKTDRPLNDASISPLHDNPKDPKMHVIMGGGQDAKDVTTSGGKGGFETTMWHMVYEEELGQIKGHFGPMNSITFFTDGRGFVTGGEDGYIRIHHFDQDYFTNKKFE